MASGHAVTCQIRYELDLDKLGDFEAYARAWILLVERYGGTHHGYFMPRPAPGEHRISFPDIGHDGPSNVAIALFSFPDEQGYAHYREMAAADPEGRSAEALYRQTHCFLRYERLFLQPLARTP